MKEQPGGVEERVSTSLATTDASPAGPAARSAGIRGGSLRGLARWETLLVLILAGLMVEGNSLSPFFLTPGNLSNSAGAIMEVAVMALAMTPIIVTGDIDLSVESMVGLSGALLGWLWSRGVSMEIAVPIILVVGALGGLFNGLLVTRGGLPSLVVTLGTLALFRGMASVLLGPTAVTNFPDWFTAFGFGTVPGTLVPWTVVVFAILAVLFWVVLHGTWLGRQVYAIGKNKETARYSGVRVATVRTALFLVSGMVAALAGLMLAGYFSSARADNGTGMTLTVVTVVVLGGVDINGGKGTISGVVLAVFTLAALQSALRLVGVSSEYQNVAIGLLLIVSVVAPQLARQVRTLSDRAHPRMRRDHVTAPGEIVR
jgi:rhamnose transport system permease protein